MAALIDLVHDYAAPPAQVWAVATDLACLQKAMKGIVRYHGLPNAPLALGQVIRTEFQAFSIGPRTPWTMEIVRFDAADMRLLSHEHGGVVKSWNHTINVTPTPDGARLHDHIEIEAGALTPLYAAWARFMYARRHKPRLRMLGLA